MKTRIRISTSPPNSHNVTNEEASYYCDLVEIDNWTEFTTVRKSLTNAIEAKLGVVSSAFIVMMAGDKEIGILIGHKDGQGELTYHAIDYLGKASFEPAANEALWIAANSASFLPNGHRLSRGSKRVELKLVPKER